MQAALRGGKHLYLLTDVSPSWVYILLQFHKSACDSPR